MIAKPDPLAVLCPRCASAPSEPCFSVGQDSYARGAPLKRCHAERYAAASATWGEAHRMAAWEHLCEGLRDSLPSDLLAAPLTLTDADIATENGFRQAWVRLVDVCGEEDAIKHVQRRAKEGGGK